MARVQVTCFKLFDTVPNKGPKKEKKERSRVAATGQSDK